MKNNFYLLLISTVLFSCDKINEPFIEKVNNGNDSNTIVQKILIEDYTGHMCGNCPRAHEVLASLEDMYGVKIISFGIHSGSFAATNTSYPEDFTTTEGDDLTSYFGVSQYPIGMVNRTAYNSQKLIGKDDWATVVASLINQTPKMGIEITNTYNSASMNLQSVAEIEFLEDITDQLKVCFFITEDSIVAPQTDYSMSPTKIDNYLHRHILRGSMNGAFGDNLPSSSYSNGSTVTINKTITLNSGWNAAYCNVVVFVYRESDEVVLQAEEKSVQ